MHDIIESSAMSRKYHTYSSERVTPVEEIPLEFRMRTFFPSGDSQILDIRLCYRFNGRELVECGSVWSHAEEEGFTSPEVS